MPRSMKALKIVNAQGKAVGPSEAAVLDGSYNPLSRPLFIYVNARRRQEAEVKEFVEFYLGQGAELRQGSQVRAVLAPRPTRPRSAISSTAELGTVFGGVPAVGLRVEELLAREAKL